MIPDATVPTDPWSAHVVAVLLRPFVEYLSSGSLIWWPFVLFSLVVAFVAYAISHRGPGLVTEFRRRFLGSAVWWHASSKADYAYYVANGILFFAVVAPLIVAGATVAAWVQAWLHAALGPVQTPLLSAGWARLLYTIGFFLAFDFGRFIAHSWLHDVAWLWPFHKVHHSAETLTPFTSYRMHPVELFLLNVASNVLTGLVSGIVWYVSGGEVGLYTFFGLHVGVAAYNAIGNLRHWHVWVSFGPVLDRWLLSPAHHQIHHSRDPRHYGKNRGYALALWDWLWGTLYVPHGEESLVFGLGDGTDGTWHSVGRMYLEPFREVWTQLAPRPVPTPAAAPVLRRRFLALGLATAACALLLRRSASAGAPPPTVFLEDLTWTEIRDAVASGMTVALVPTGGTEQNGPHMAVGKHNAIVRAAAGEIARRLGNALVAPVIAYVPEGRFDPPEGHLRFPGTLGVSEATFAAELGDAATSLALAGFTLICFVGDHGGSQPAQAEVAQRLTTAWRQRGVRVANLGRYYAANGQEDWLKAHGFTAREIGTHAGLVDTAELLAVEPAGVRPGLLSPRTWPFGTTGVAGDPSRATAAVGQTLIELKIVAGVAEMREILADMAKG
jgi:creatinine amidohydrolase/Fe(II)-dependent formamide hydrolase-like protein/sterol desaturase/sphingolipid hydroxylase (fatty acid hydroxylase superfamily)